MAIPCLHPLQSTLNRLKLKALENCCFNEQNIYLLSLLSFISLPELIRGSYIKFRQSQTLETLVCTRTGSRRSGNYARRGEVIKLFDNVAQSRPTAGFALT